MRSQTQLLLDIFGNLFRPVSLDPTWLTPTVGKIAQAIYDDRTFDGLPILPTPWKKLVARIPKSCPTAKGQGRMSGAAGRWISPGEEMNAIRTIAAMLKGAIIGAIAGGVFGVALGFLLAPGPHPEGRRSLEHEWYIMAIV